MVEEIDHCFKAFDQIVDKYNLEKIKTIGDAYMCAGGLPSPDDKNATKAVQAALAMQEFLESWKETRINTGQPFFEARIGIHTGPIVAGVVGVKKFAYDIWGDTVNIASRMEANSEAGQVNISESTYALVKDEFQFTPRGKFKAKNKGEIEMYYVKGKGERELYINFPGCIEKSNKYTSNGSRPIGLIGLGNTMQNAHQQRQAFCNSRIIIDLFNSQMFYLINPNVLSSGVFLCSLRTP